MAIPTSSAFSIFDWDPAAAGGALLIGDVADGLLQEATTSARITGPPYTNVAGSGDVTLFSNDGILTDLVIEQNVGNNFTFEFSMRAFGAGLLPQTLDNPDAHRVFIAASDAQGNAGGVLISQAGLAIVSQPGNMVLPFSQSSGLIPQDGSTFITIRLAVNGGEDTIDVYVTTTSDVSTTGHILRYTIKAPASTTGVDRAHIEVLGSQERPVGITLRSFRLSPQVLMPHKRPIADAGSDQTKSIESTIQLVGSGSSDPEGALLSYSWTVVSRPTGSAVTMSGGGTASLTQDNLAATPNDGITFLAPRSGNDGNAITVVILDPGAALQELGLTVDVTDTVSISLQTDVAGSLITTYEELRQAIILPGSLGYDEEVAALITASLANGGDGFDKVRAQAKANLAGGLDSGIANPVFTPDQVGSYQFQLIVNDGQLDSLPSSVIVVAANTTQPLDFIPDADYIWGGLPDFWGLIPDRQVFSTFWSTAIQAISGELLKAWQTDYAKSLNDIGRLYTRKWLRYSPFLPDTGTISAPTELSGTVGKATEDGDGDLTTTLISDANTNFSTVSNGDLFVDKDNSLTFEISRTGDAVNQVVVKEDSALVYDLIDSGGPGRATTDITVIQAGSPATGRSARVLHPAQVTIGIDNAADLSSPSIDGSHLVLRNAAGDPILGAGNEEFFIVQSVNNVDDSFSPGFKTVTLGVAPNPGVIVGDASWTSQDYFPRITSNLWATSGTFKSALITPGDLLRITSDSTVQSSLILGAGNNQMVLRARRAGIDGHTITFELIAGTNEVVAVTHRRIQATFNTGVSTVSSMITAIDAHPEVSSLVSANMGSGDGTGVLVAGDAIDPKALASVSPVTSATSSKITLSSLTNPTFPAAGEANILEMALPVTDESWEVIRPASSFNWAVPYYVTSTLDLENDQLIKAGDQIRFLVTNTTTNTASTIHCDVLGARKTKVGFDSANLLAALGGSITTEDYTYTYQGVVRLNQLPLDEDVTSIPMLKYPVASPTTTLKENENYSVASKALSFSAGQFSGQPAEDGSSQLPPDELWGEVTYFDNSARIEGNFGRLAGLTKEDLTSANASLDYLSAVKALWYAFFGGPKVSNIRLGAQTFFGLPMAEAAGTIAVLDTGYTPTQGRIVIQDRDNDQMLRSYKYSLATGLDTNPATGSTYVEGDTVEMFATLSKGVTVDDYVKSPRWFMHHINDGYISEVEKYFLFRVQLDTNAADTKDFGLAVSFVNSIKPVYTSPVFTALFEIDDDQVSATDTLREEGKLFLVDNPRGAPDQPSGGSPLDSIGHPTACVVDAYDGKGSWTGSAVDIEFSADRVSPRYNIVVGAGGTNLVSASTIPAEYSIATGVGAYSFVVLQGTLADDGVYNFLGVVGGTAINIAELDTGNAVALTVGDTGKAFMLQGPYSVADPPSAAVYPGHAANAGHGVNKSFKYLDHGVNEPKYTIDGGIVPYSHTANRRVRINMDMLINGVAQKGPRVDQGLIVDDYLTMELTVSEGGLLADTVRQPNMHNNPGIGSSIAGNGLFWWWDGGDGADLATPQEALHEKWLVDVPHGNIRPDGAAVTSGLMLRVIGHKGISKPPMDPDMLVDHDPNN